MPRLPSQRSAYSKEQSDLHHPAVIEAKLQGFDVESLADVRRLATNPAPRDTGG